MIEKMGKVTLDYSKYSGQDLYCDGAVEDELLAIAKNLSPVEFADEIEKRESWPILYHLSPLRENIVDWVPMKKTDRVLEVGSGCGAITGAFSRKAQSVTCVELSKKRSMINAYRHSECDNITIHVGNFKDIEPELPNDFDYICLIGVFEYAASYIGGDTPFEDFLKILTPHLAKGGRILIAIENKYGMKYFAGCKEDHVGSYFSGIENYADGGHARTFCRTGLEKIFANCGVENAQFYYPYPDYKFMTTLYSDAHLPGKGELSNNIRNFDRDRMLLFDEKNAFDGVTEEGLFSVFANSYLAVIGAPFETEYVKYSNDRAKEYQIRTEIGTDRSGERYVRKYPMTEEARNHVAAMGVACRSLKERYAGGELEVNHCRIVEKPEGMCAEFEFVQGQPLSEILDKCLEKGDIEGFHAYFDEYLRRTGYNAQFPVSDFDLIFANLLVNKDQWTLIDYEWTFGKAIPMQELAFRAIYCYILEDEKRNKLDLDLILNKLEISEAQAETFREMELDFQKMVSGHKLSLAQLGERIGNRVMVPQKWIHLYEDRNSWNRVQIYEDKGEGCKEEESYFVKDAYVGDSCIEMELSVPGNVNILRIDPAFASCVVRIEKLLFNDEPVPFDKKKVLLVNGRIAKPATLIFPTQDPNINIVLSELERLQENTLYVKMEIVRLPQTIAEEMANSVKKIY